MLSRESRTKPSRGLRSAPPARWNGREQPPATRDAGGSAKADRKICTNPEVNTCAPAASASSATEAKTKNMQASIVEHSAAHKWRLVSL
jgi:hypothetical protein